MQYSKLSSFSAVVLDECHYFMNDIFNSKTGFILDRAISTFKYAIRIYLSATPNDVFGLIVDKEKSIGTQDLLHYSFKRDYRYVNTRYFSSYNEIIDAINQSSASSKWIIFVSSISEGNLFIESFGEKAVFITSKSKDSKKIDGKVYDEIINDEKFNSCTILVTTKVLDNGVNLKDKNLNNVVILTHDQTEFIQMLGRKRILNNETLNLYICSRDISYFNLCLHKVNRQIQAICSFKKNYKYFVEHYLLGEENNHKLVKNLLYIDSKGLYKINRLAEIKIFSEKLLLEGMISKFESGIKEAFILAQLNWLGLSKTYNDRSWLSYKHSNDNIEKFKSFLDQHVNIPLTDAKRELFETEFKNYLNLAHGKQKGDRPDRPSYKLIKIRKMLEDYNYPYAVIDKGNTLTLTKI